MYGGPPRDAPPAHPLMTLEPSQAPQGTQTQVSGKGRSQGWEPLWALLTTMLLR